MNWVEEIERISYYLSSPRTQQVFQVLRDEVTYCQIGIMVEPGGYIELNNPPISGFQPRWDVVVNSETSRPCHCMFYLDVGSMTQAFMACVYVATTRLGLPMPFEVIQFDPEFYDLLPTLTPTNSTHYVIAIIEATRNEACAFSFYF
ncbi:unnamed protein product [Hymenolepis diminuta]|uniref:Uncharacterized protein n=1 Tax=Hymenolepis diminuta TaxID=6216 RepID=A0A564YQH3_HYMDI|nr:unnamed protein product [Hymenolepis diminuta]